MATELLWLRKRLEVSFGLVREIPRRRPLDQLMKSLISSRTKDEVSLRAYRRMRGTWPRVSDLAVASPPKIEGAIFDVTFAEKKATYLPSALRIIGAERSRWDLEFLGNLPVEEALAWLERLPGVGRKVAAMTLNASILKGRVFVVDSHVHRVLRRLGFIGDKTSAKAASELVTASASSFDADALHGLFVQLKLLGQTICRFEAPLCPACPLALRCRMSGVLTKSLGSA